MQPLTKRHLSHRHRVENRTELGLLLALSTGRFKGHLDCTVCDKQRLSRLDRHLANMHGITGSELTQMLATAKEECIIRKLADLRARGPEPLMKESILQVETDEQNQAVVWVDHHKTDRTVGNAFIALLPLEVDWLKGLIEVSAAHFGGDQCPYIFQFDW
ncbi:hypothetical protein MHYP_G00347070 [Metynnis hypsauchen]